MSTDAYPMPFAQDPASYVGESTSFATIVTLLPFKIIEKKPGLIPGQFEIPAADPGDFAVLVIKDSFHYVYLDSDRGSIPSTDPALKVAQSIVYDYVANQLLREDGVEPGLFCVPGRYTKDEISKKFASILVEAKARQRRWYERLVALADDDWAMNHKRKGISDLSRHAARGLSVTREWLNVAEEDRPIQITAAVECPACFSAVRAEASTCPVCKFVIDPKKLEALQAARK